METGNQKLHTNIKEGYRYTHTHTHTWTEAFAILIHVDAATFGCPLYQGIAIKKGNVKVGLIYKQ